MVRPIEIPEKHYEYMRKFFKDDQETWEEIKEDIAKLRGWAKMMRDAGWYNVDDDKEYKYYLSIESNGLKITRE